MTRKYTEYTLPHSATLTHTPESIICVLFVSPDCPLHLFIYTCVWLLLQYTNSLYYQPKHLNTLNVMAIRSTHSHTLIFVSRLWKSHSYTFNPFACHGIYLYDICDIYALLRTLHALVRVLLPLFMFSFCSFFSPSLFSNRQYSNCKERIIFAIFVSLFPTLFHCFTMCFFPSCIAHASHNSTCVEANYKSNRVCTNDNIYFRILFDSSERQERFYCYENINKINIKLLSCCSRHEPYWVWPRTKKQQPFAMEIQFNCSIKSYG